MRSVGVISLFYGFDWSPGGTRESLLCIQSTLFPLQPVYRKPTTTYIKKHWVNGFNK